MTRTGIPAGVGRTAIGTARVRATESRRPDRLFDDPLAAAFVRAVDGAGRPADAAGGESLTGRVMAEQVVLRTRFFDDYLHGAVADGRRTQVVLVAAGLDTRAFRLEWPGGVGVFELDLPDVVRFKEEVLAGAGAVPRCRRAVVGVDLRGEWAGPLRNAGFDPAAPTAWLVEGLLIYLAADEAATVLGTVGELSAPGSVLSFTHGRGLARMVEQTRTGDEFRPVSDLWQGGLSEPADAWLTRHGWTVTAHEKAALEAAYGRGSGQRSGPWSGRPAEGAFQVAERG